MTGDNTRIAPWQQDQWQRLLSLRERDRLPHALLVTGPAGIGKRMFVDAFAMALLCEAAVADSPCGHCHGCRSIAAGTHPDHLVVEPTEAGKAIGIDQVRELTERLALTGSAATKLARLEPADALTTAAANSLLKTLEEPPGRAMLILVADRPGRLMATVRSRCQRVAFGLPPRDEALAWLEAQGGVERPAELLDCAGGAPLRAIEWQRAEGAAIGPIVEALLTALQSGRVDGEALAAGTGQALDETITIATMALEDLIRLCHDSSAHIRLSPLRERLLAVASGVDASTLFAYLEQVRQSRPGPSSSLRADSQWHGVLAGAARMAHPSSEHT